MEGYVYILTNQSMPDLLKIGSTKRSPEERKRELSKPTGVPQEFIVAYEIYTTQMTELESFIHCELDKCRINRNREFFKVDLYETIPILQRKAEEIRLNSNFKSKGINELLDIYEAIEILGMLKERYFNMMKPEIKSVRIYQTRLRCYLEITEEKVQTGYHPIALINQKIERIDLGFISSSSDSENNLFFKPSVSVAENARIFINEFDDYSKLMCCDELFTEVGIENILDNYSKMMN